VDSEHPDAFAEALALVNARMPSAGGQLQIDALWGDPPHIAVARWGTRLVTGMGDTPAAALRDLARQLPESPSSG
jgi:hypothetical protein